MKKHIAKLITLLLFTSVLAQSCSVQYRENRRKRIDEQHQHDHDHDDDHHDDEHHN